VEDLQEKLNKLDKAVGEIIMLVVPAEKIETASNLITKYTTEFYNKVKELKDPINTDEFNKAFNPFVNNTMSVIETLGVSKRQYKSVRKLVLNELYGFKNKLLLGNLGANDKVK